MLFSLDNKVMQSFEQSFEKKKIKIISPIYFLQLLIESLILSKC